MARKTILITGGTGSFGQTCVDILLKSYSLKRLIVFSRDEAKQHQMRQKFPDDESSPLRYFIGDVRDKQRLLLAFKGVDTVIHTAALKQIDICEYNPSEAIQTNIDGARNIIEAATECKVKKVIALSSDKAVNSVTLYGSTKAVAERLFIAANALGGPKFSIVRYGNVVGSRGSVIPLFLKQKEKGCFKLTDSRMTRFWVTIEGAVKFVLFCLKKMQGGEVYVPKMGSCQVKYFIDAIADGQYKIETIGIRAGEKLHEVLVAPEEANRTYDLGDYYVILPAIRFFGWDWKFSQSGVTIGQVYNSHNNPWQFSVKDARKLIDKI